MANSGFILGINGGVRPGYQDIAAVLISQGKIIAAVEEERINRVKHSAGQFPILAIKEILRIANIRISDIEIVATHGITWQSSIEQVIQNHFLCHFGYCPEIIRFHHHDCHAASTYFLSGFQEAIVLTIDGSGDGVSTQIAIGKGLELTVLNRIPRPQSLGIFYSMMTQLCGFTRDMDEYKLMGLAAYGKPDISKLSRVFETSHDEYRLNTEYLVDFSPGQPSPSRFEMLYNHKLTELLGCQRRVSKEIEQQYRDIASSTQFLLEQAIINLIRKYVGITQISKVCLAGGVALNCLANHAVESLNEVSDLFIQPASNDAGISLGAAILASLQRHKVPFEKQISTAFGYEYSEQELEWTLQMCGIQYTSSQDIIHDATLSLLRGEVIGWFQGRMEFGPRALGNRSILANPATEGIQHIVNSKVKFRESFRPFGASVAEEDFNKFFIANCNDAPFMTKVFKVRENYKKQLQGVTHQDGTCRVQTVNQKQNERFYKLLISAKNVIGLPVLLNTSFNLNHEPIVNTPREAIASFFSSGLDTLFIGNFIVNKS